MSLFQKLKKIDGVLLGTTLLLVCFGLVTLYSITLNQAEPDFFRIYKQGGFLFIGVLFILLMFFFDYRTLQAYDHWFLIAIAVLLIGVLLFGVEIRGAQGWFIIAGVQWQPVEISKLLYIIWMSSYIQKHYKGVLLLRDVLITGIATLAIVILILMQPDFGSAILFVGMWVGTMMVIKIERKYIVTFFLSLPVIAVALWTFVLYDYQKERLLTFFRPSLDSLGAGYNVTQSIISIGSGQFFGRGLGLGPQSQLNFLPERETDFIFAVIAEELGFIGASVVLLLFAILLFKVFLIAMKSTNTFGTFIAVNVAAIIFIQMTINVGMNMGIMPVTGIPLPFVSAGGSALITDLLAIGILQNIRVKTHKNN